MNRRKKPSQSKDEAPPRTTASVVTAYCHKATSNGSSAFKDQQNKERISAPIGSPDDIGTVAQPIAVAHILASSYRRKTVLFHNCRAQRCSEIPSRIRLSQNTC